MFSGFLPNWDLQRRPDSDLEDWAVVEVVGARSALQRGKGHVSSGERRDVAEVIGAERLLLVAAGLDEAVARLPVGLLAGAAVVLVRHPGAALSAPLVDGEALRTAGVELQPNVGDVEGLTCRQTWRQKRNPTGSEPQSPIK